MQEATSTDSPSAETDVQVRPLAVTALVGAIAGAAIVGFSVLASRLVTLTSGRPAVEVLGGPATWVTWLYIASAVVAAGACSGVASRRRSWPGLVMILVLGACAAWTTWPTESSATSIFVPLIATLAGAATFGILLHSTRARRAGLHRAGSREPFLGDQKCDVADRLVISRRRTLVTGALIAAGAGLTGLFVGSPPFRQPSTTSPPTTTEGPRLSKGPVMNVRDFGAIGDGRTDDGKAIRESFSAANETNGSLFFPAGTYYYVATDALFPGPGVSVVGVPGASRIDFDYRGTKEFVQFCSLDADNVTIDGLIIRRAADFSAVLLGIGAVQGFTLSRTTLVGSEDVFPGTYCHGIKLGDDESGTTSGVHLLESTVTTMHFGLLQTNASTAATTDIRVERCTFTSNRNTDLEFNSPNGSIRQLHIEECAFSDNDSPGFGVGLAHVSDALIRSCRFSNYSLEAIHIEDYSENVTVQDNDFSACGLRNHSHVQIIGGSRGVRVVDNTFRAGTNTKTIYVVNALPGGTEPTVGGRDPIPPFDVLVHNNTFECGEPVVPVYFQGIRDSAITNNQIVGGNLSGPESAFRLLDDIGTAISDNEINGRTY